MTQSKPLREAVKARFYPWLESHGFVRGKTTWLSAVFRRRDPQKLCVCEIQWEKSRRPCFVINFGEIAYHNLTVPENEVEIWHCDTIGRLRPRDCPYLRCWFHLRKPWVEVLRSGRLLYEPHEVVDQVITLFPEIEVWWDEKRDGPHLRSSSRAG
jgi:hypothetical protein